VVAPQTAAGAAGSTAASSSDGAEAEGESCNICLQGLLTADVLKVLPCKHRFHEGCIREWLVQHNRRCPLCNADVC
jgi:hypothetical protein